MDAGGCQWSTRKLLTGPSTDENEESYYYYFFLPPTEDETSSVVLVKSYLSTNKIMNKLNHRLRIQAISSLEGFVLLFFWGGVVLFCFCCFLFFVFCLFVCLFFVLATVKRLRIRR